METLPERRARGTWVQTERAAHEAWSGLIGKSPLAAQLLHLLVARCGDHNAVVISQGALATLAGASRRGVQRALEILAADRWIEIRQLGQTTSVNAYVVNDRVAWVGPRDGIRYSLFSAVVVASEVEQPDADALDDPHRPPLRRLPRVGELQSPAGPGLDPPSQPALPGYEQDLPAAGSQLDIEDFTRR